MAQETSLKRPIKIEQITINGSSTEQINTTKDTSNLSPPSVLTERPRPGDDLFPVFHEIQGNFIRLRKEKWIGTS